MWKWLSRMRFGSRPRNSLATALVFAPQMEREARRAPILFVHGAWHGAWCWEDHFVPYFANRGWQVTALNLRAHGGPRERRGLRWKRIADYVEDLAAAAAALPEPPVVIGHSTGGLVGQKYLESHPARATAASCGEEIVVFPELPHDVMGGPGWQLVAGRIESWLASALEVGVDVDVPLAAGAAVGPEIGEVAEGDGAGGGEREPEQDLAVAEVGEHLVDTPVEDGAAGQLQPVHERRKRGEKG